MRDGQRLYHRLSTLVAGISFCGAAGAAIEPSCATPDTSSTITTCFFDLTTSPSSTQTSASEVLNGGLFRVPASDGELGQGFTGVLQPFVRIQEDGNNGNSNSSGITYSTDPGGSNWIQPIKLGDIPKVTVCDGGGSTGANCRQYYEFLLDVSKPAGTTGISLDAFKLFVAGKKRNTPEATGTNDSTKPGDANRDTGPHHAASAADRLTTRDRDRPRPVAPLPGQRLHLSGTEVPLTGATLQYDMDAAGDASLLMDYGNFSGSGVGLQALVPVTHFAGVAADTLVYLYSKFGWTASDGTTGAVGRLEDAGVAEWSIRQGLLPGQTPTPATALLLALGLAGLVTVRRATATRREA